MAVVWYRRAAERGDVLAQYNLGCYFEQGKGVAQDRTLAVVWYRKAAEQGDPEAQCNLGCCYLEGHGVAESSAHAFTCLVYQVSRAREFNSAVQLGHVLCERRASMRRRAVREA